MDEQEWMDLAEEAGQLREALASRARIKQAKGVIMVLCATSDDDAYELLRTTSMRHNVKLAAFAAVIVDVAADEGPARTLEVLTQWLPDLATRRSVGPGQRASSASAHAGAPSRAGRRRTGA